MIPLDLNWSYMGSRADLWEASTQSEDGNILTGDVFSVGTSNSYVYSESRLVSTVGINDLIVVETKDAVLVAHKDHVQDVKEIVEKLKAAHEPISLQFASSGTMTAC